MSSSNSKKEKKNVKALFSIICLCIVALGLIVYFATSTKQNNLVNEATTLEQTTEVQHAVTLKETTTESTTALDTTATTQATTMSQDDSNTPYKSYYQYPISESVLKGYSEDLVYDNTMGDYRAHTAVDFSGNEGDSVYAINNGLVLEVYTDDMYGLSVKIDHGGTFIVDYCGLESANVKKGDFISIGDVIGTLGKVPCESSDSPHLHLTSTLDGKSVDPLDPMGKTE